MKRCILLFLSLMLFVSFSLPVQASDHQLKVYLNGMKLGDDMQARIVKGSVLVSLNVFTALGAQASLDKNSGAIQIVLEQQVYSLTVNSKKIRSGNKEWELPAAPAYMDGNVFIPLTWFTEQFKVKSIFDRLTKSIFLFQKARQIEMQDKTITIETSAASSAEAPTVQAAAGLSTVGSIINVKNQIVIQLDAGVSPSSFYLENPDRIVLDLPNSTLGSTLNGLTPEQNGVIESRNPLIKGIRYSLFSKEPSTVRVVVDLHQSAKYSIVENKQANQVIVALNQFSYKVVLDPGHGGKDPGATGFSKSLEKDFTLAVSMKVHKLLENEPLIQSYMTRTDDSFPSLSDRAEFANKLNADLFISIHGNTFEQQSVSGTETYYMVDQSKLLAQTMHKHILQATGFRDRGIRKEDFKVLKETKMHAVLLEIGYMSNPGDEAAMLKGSVQDRIAQAIVTAMKEYFGIY
jgi:N-acetylmuramoyl-L-alanine amidase